MENDLNEYQKVYTEMIRQLDIGAQLIAEYDSIPHDYGAAVLYQAESQIIHLIGKHPGITATELASITSKTPSACSQLIRKLKSKKWVKQLRNEGNNRQYQLFLTESGEEIYEDHSRFEQCCYQRYFDFLSSFSMEECRSYIKIQKILNHAFSLDVEESKRSLGDPHEEK